MTDDKNKLLIVYSHGMGEKGKNEWQAKHLKKFMEERSREDGKDNLEIHTSSISYKRDSDDAGRGKDNDFLTKKAVNHVKEQMSEHGISPGNIILIGHSRGAYAATRAANEFEKEGTPLRAVVQSAPVKSARDAVQSLTGLPLPVTKKDYLDIMAENTRLQETPVHTSLSKKDALSKGVKRQKAIIERNNDTSGTKHLKSNGGHNDPFTQQALHEVYESIYQDVKANPNKGVNKNSELEVDSTRPVLTIKEALNMGAILDKENIQELGKSLKKSGLLEEPDSQSSHRKLNAPQPHRTEPDGSGMKR
jgi:predicted esterase